MKNIETKIHGKDKIGFLPKNFISPFVYGGIDGAITTFAVVSGATGANLEISVIVILGFANLIADGFSMSVGSYFSSKTEHENYDKFLNQELWEIDNLKDKEIEEVKEIYQKKGFKGELLEKVVETIIADKKVWLETMMLEELNLIKDEKTPYQTALATFISFNLVGFIPLSIYLFGNTLSLKLNELFFISSFLTLLALGLVGWLKSLVTNQSKIRSILETILLGSIASVLAYLVGNFLEKFL